MSNVNQEQFAEKFKTQTGMSLEEETRVKPPEDLDERFEQGVEEAKDAIDKELSDDDLEEQVVGGMGHSYRPTRS